MSFLKIQTSVKRIYFPYWEWECFHAGMYKRVPPEGKTSDQCKQEYCVFLKNIEGFNAAMIRIKKEWPISCKQFLTNENINRIAWIGQASMCIETGIPRVFRSGFCLLNKDEQRNANMAAFNFLKDWLENERERQNKCLHKRMVQLRLW